MALTTTYGNTKLAFGVYHRPDAAGEMSHFSKFTPSIYNIITPHTMNQSNAAIESRINDAFDAFSEGLYMSIIATVQNFDILTQIL